MFKRRQHPTEPAAPDVEGLRRKIRQLLEEVKRERRIRRALETTVDTLQKRNER